MFESSGFDSIEEEIERGSFEIVDTFPVFDELEFMGFRCCHFRIGNNLKDISSTDGLGETGDEDGDRWSSRIKILAAKISEESNTTVSRSTDDIVSFFDGSCIDEDG